MTFRLLPSSLGLLRASLALAFTLQAAESARLQPFNTEPATNGPMPAAEVVAKTLLPTGFQMTVFAAEPDVHQPIGMATDARGRLWVAENYTYSERTVGYHPELRDRIVVFEDADNDGHFDKRTVFWDGAERLTSVEVGLGGVWALALPNLVFIPDENGDAIPDSPPQVVLDGFEYQNGRHTIANGLRWGPDGWLYGRHGILSTSLLGPPGTPPEQRTAMNVGIWRYHPTRRVTEVVAQGTTNPWGMDWDARGELFFINTVIGHLWQVIPGAHYRRMFGTDPAPFIYEVIEQTADHVHWATGEVWTDVRNGVSDVTLAAGGGHAHTGLLIYQGGQWPTAWNNRLLTINFHGRRLNVEQLDRRGSGFVGRHQPDAFMFADPWFRGIDLLAAPDGGIFVSDWSDAGECHDHDGIHRTSGRIYKVTYGAKRSGVFDLTKLTGPELAAQQTNINDWVARQARRVLADRFRRGASLSEARAALQRLAELDSDEIVRLRALWSLHVSGGVEEVVLKRMEAGTEYERSWAILLREDARHASPVALAQFDRWVETQLPELAASEKSARVRLTLASLLQKLSLTQRLTLAPALLAHAEDADDRQQPLMLWYGLEPLATNEARFMEVIAAGRIPRVQRLAARRLAEDIDAAPQRVDALLASVARNESTVARQAVLDGLADGLAGRRKVSPPSSWSTLQSRFAEGADDSLKNRLQDLSALFGDGRALEQIREVALNPEADIPRRRAALQTLIDARAERLREVCEKALPVRDLSATAANGLALTDDPAIADRLLAEWPNLYGHERPPVRNVLLSRPTWVAKLLDAVASGKLRRSDLGVVEARQIRNYNNEALNRRLAEVWGTIQDPDEATRQQSLNRWQQKLTPANLKRASLTEGQKLYAASCGACHLLYGAGGTLGPDLTGSGRQNLDYLLENILFPHAVVPTEFRQTTLNLKDGRALSGVIRNRTEQMVVLEMVGERATVVRADIQQEETSPLSLMPEGMLDALTESQATDLIAFLMGSAPPAEK